MTRRASRVGRAVALGALALALLALGAWALAPKPALYEGVTFATLVTDRQGRPLRLLPAEDGRFRLFTPLADIAPAVQRATLLYEDRRFRWHPGVDPVALARGAWTTYVHGTRRVGGSTITMQLARMRFALDTRSPFGKLVQCARALQIERHYGKSEILEAYLNLAPYGGAVEGIGAASRIYFDKPASQLEVGEALALAVIPQNPAARFPATAAGRRELLAARQRLLTRWPSAAATLLPDAAGASPSPAAPAAENTARAQLVPVFRSPSQLPFRAPHFVRDHVAAARLASPSRPAPAEIRTTLDLGAQSLLEARIRDHMERRRRDGIRNAAAMLIDHRSMEVLAQVGSAAFFDAEIAGQVNGARARRSPGSTLKPLLYGLALDAGLIHPMTLLADAPRRFAAYTPENFDRGFLGPVLARDALIHSRNVPAVYLLAQLGVARFRDWLATAGVGGLRAAEEYGLALALGGSEASMEELVRLYALLANGGVYRDLATRLPPAPAAPPRRALSGEASYLVLDMLRDVPRPDAARLPGSPRPPVAWKTGTSFGYRDAWSIGVAGRYVLAVWVGNFDGTANPALVGRRAAAPLFFAIADGLQLGGAEPSIAGLNLRQVDVCATTGDLPGRYCPRTQRSWFIPGVSPIRVSSVYRAVWLDTRTGERSCRPGAMGTRKVVREFWPAELDAVFRRAGIAIRRPPPWSSECDLDIAAATGQAPRIRSPQRAVAYRARRGVAGQGVLFAAAADADARALFWFVDDRFVARVDARESYFWKPRPGRFTVRVVDDHGRADAVPIVVRDV